MIHILMSGGSGTRLWPLSRLRMPKQYLPLLEGQSLFENTVNRHTELCSSHIVVTNASQFALAKRQMGQAETTYILESVGRNTAPAIGMACRLLPEETVVLVTPSDHLIRDVEAYHRAARQAAELAKDGYLVTFGVEPEYPEIGFGYIKRMVPWCWPSKKNPMRAPRLRTSSRAGTTGMPGFSVFKPEYTCKSFNVLPRICIMP